MTFDRGKVAIEQCCLAVLVDIDDKDIATIEWRVMKQNEGTTCSETETVAKWAKSWHSLGKKCLVNSQRWWRATLKRQLNYCY